MHFPRFAQSAVALVLMTIGFAAPVHAQNNKQIISGSWYEDRASTGTNTGSLFMTFAQTPTNQFLNITNVACTVTTTSAQIITAMQLNVGTASGVNDLGRAYEIKGNVTPEVIGGGKYYSIVNNQIYFKFGPGRYPSILFAAPSPGAASIAADCVIVGNLTDN